MIKSLVNGLGGEWSGTIRLGMKGPGVSVHGTVSYNWWQWSILEFLIWIMTHLINMWGFFFSLFFFFFVFLMKGLSRK